MLKLIGLGTVSTVLAACAQKTATQPPQPIEKPTEAIQPTAAVTATEKPPAATAAPTKTPPPAKAVKIIMVESWFSVPQFKESIDPVTKAISDKMKGEGVNIEIESMILDDHEHKYPVLYAAGADFTMAFDAPWYKMNTLRDQGALVQIESLLDQYGPKLKEEVTEKILEANYYKDHLYGIPTAYYYAGTSGAQLRYDLLKKYNAPEPTSEGGHASMQPFLEAIAKNEPNMIPYALDAAYCPVHENFLLRRKMGPGVDGKTGVIIPDISKGYTFVDIETIPEIVEQAKLMRTWWEKGLINKTDLPASGPTINLMIDYVFPGRAASCVENEPDYKWYDTTKALKSSIPTGEMRGYDLTGLRAGKVRGLGALKQWNFIVINAGATQEKQLAAIQYFNWLASSQDNMDLWLMGIDGTNYKKEANLRFSEIAGVDQARNYRRQWYVSGISGRFQRQPVDLPKEAEEALKFFSTESNWDFNPYEGFEIDTKAVELETTQLQAVWAEAYHGLATGQIATDAAITKFKKTLDDAGRQQYKEKVQKQLDDYIAAHK
jgi:putative aldouronate transport system substrate-binding protein